MLSQTLTIEELIRNNGWDVIPSTILTRNGLPINTSGPIWHLPYPELSNSSINFTQISEPLLRWALQAYVRDRIERVSVHAGLTAFLDVWRLILRYWGEIRFDPQNRTTRLIRLYEQSINTARLNHRLWDIYRAIQWYSWCAERYPEIGFSTDYSMVLQEMPLPGNPKGEAVRVEDPQKGPLHMSLELPLIVNALKNDTSNEFLHMQEKVVVALSIAFGRNPTNLLYLREIDFKNLTTDSENPCHILRIPRIKKRQLSPRDDFREEYLEPIYAKFVSELIEFNKCLDLAVNNYDLNRPDRRPILVKLNGNKSALRAGDLENAFNMTHNDVNHLLHKFIRRHKIISPRTGKLINMTPRRMRYTLATGLAAEGISKRELARILDHTDTQHVHVYFDAPKNIIQHLDKAMAKGFIQYIDLFKGKIVEGPNDAINGERNDKQLFFVNENNPQDQTDIGVCGETKICHLDPPYSCYLCPKFQPYRDADHEHVLDCLLQGRETRLKKYEHARLGVQLDEVITAVAQVANLCCRSRDNV